jgi:TonB family protein
MRSPSWRFTIRNAGRRLALALLILPAAAISTAQAAPRIELGSHISRVDHPFALSNAQWDQLFVATTPGGKSLSAQQLRPLVLHAEWPANYVDTMVHWHLKVGVFLLNVRGDGTVSSIGILQRIGHPQMDGATVRAFAKWRFRPNSVGAVRVPSTIRACSEAEPARAARRFRGEHHCPEFLIPNAAGRDRVPCLTALFK